MSRVREYRSEEPIRPSPSFLLAPLDYLTPHSVSELIKSYFSDFNMEEDHHKQRHRHLPQEASNQFLTEEQAREQGTSEEGQDKDKEQVEEEEEKGEEEEEDEESVVVVVDDPATPPTLVVPETLSTALVELGDEKKRECMEAYQKKIGHYSQLEQHIHGAISRQLSEQEAQLKSACSTYPNFNNLFLLQQSYPISKYLNEKLLKEGGLLVPSDYRPVPVTPSQQPSQREWPVFMQNTVSSKEHARVDPPPFKKMPLKLPPIWKDSMSSEDREQAKKSLKELHRKRQFIHSPRGLTQEYHTNTASFGTLRKRQASEKPNRGTGGKRIFQADPMEVIFTNYLPGETYERVLHLRNISDSCRHVSITAPSTPYFRASLIQFPNPDGIVAPGMSCSYSISFTPDSLADFSDKIKVLSHVGVVLSVPLIGYRPPPNLSLSSEWQCGHCLVGGESLLTLHCTNNGGEGDFRLTTEDGDINNEDSVTDALNVGPFTIEPNQFSLSNDQVIDIKVTFKPQSSVTYTQQLTLICDNGQTNSIKLSGTGDMVDVGCVCINPLRDTVLDPLTEDNCITDPVLNFDNTNNGVEMRGTVVVKNFSNVPLSFEWIFYNPRTELRGSDDSTEVTPPIPLTDQSSPFTVNTPNGTLLPREAKPFTFSFLPIEDGSYQCMSYLELTDVPKQSLDNTQEGTTWINVQGENNDDNEIMRAAVLCIGMQGSTEPYEVEFSPPFFILVEELLACTETRKSFMVKNHSLSGINFSWSSMKTECVDITIEPNNGYIVPGGCCACEVVISTGTRSGPFDVQLQCNIEHSNTLHSLLVRGNVKFPLVTVDVPCLQFGLIQLGQSVSRSLSLTNHCSSSLHYQLNQIVILSDNHDNDDTPLLPFVDYECLSMSPSQGHIAPSSSVTVSVECSPKLRCGRLRTTLECLIEGERLTVLEVIGEVQRPMLILSESFLHIETCYKNIPVTHTLTLLNTTLLHTQYQWINEERDHVDLVFTPDHGSIGPHESISIELKSTWKTKGYIAGMIAVCCGKGMDYPVVLSLSANILGLTVEYNVLSTDHQNSSLSSLVMDFGSSNHVREPKSLHLIVTNTSGISSNLSLSVRHYPSPQTGREGGAVVTDRKQKSKLLKSRPNVTNPDSKTMKQAKEELITQLLADGRGSCFTIEPSECPLLAFESRKIIITAYSDMWGQYTDQLICKVDGIDAHVIPVMYGVISSPILFQSTATYDHTLIRLGCHQVDSDIVTRHITLSNVSSTVICIDWRSFIIDPNDVKMIDLITHIGHPFPLQEGTLQQQEEDDKTSSPLIRAHLLPHEGTPTSEINIKPSQLVVEAHSRVSVCLSFDPRASLFKSVGECVNGYALGYMSISDKSTLHSNRSQGYNIQPVRINVSASLTHPKLILKTHTDNNDLSFQHLASDFIVDGQVNVKMRHSHNFTLTNPTLSNLKFHVLPLLDPLTVSLKSEENCITLKPKEAVEGCLDISLTHEHFLSLIKSNTAAAERVVMLRDTLTIEYSNGITQDCPISVSVYLPSLSVYPVLIDNETSVIGHELLSSFQLINNSHSSLKWNIAIPKKSMKVVQVDPLSGILSTGSKTVRVTFTPRAEVKYSVELLVTEEITGDTFTVTITGRGSANERYKRQRRN